MSLFTESAVSVFPSTKIFKRSTAFISWDFISNWMLMSWEGMEGGLTYAIVKGEMFNKTKKFRVTNKAFSATWSMSALLHDNFL
ncbi:MAG: hypothetical protein A2Z60_01500 [Nitrospirae bacterium RIFCSPLOWO2_02_42_7]|nr:MAG: hypothetical protein A2Z60_01500 [Nitrospirae bacterium RIFCSPLOWO2_02_42_7]